MVRILHSLWKFAQSKKLVVWLLVSLGALIILSRFIPQRSADVDLYLSWRKANPFWGSILQRSGLSDIYSSWIFIGLCAALFISTAACTLQRIITLIGAERRPPSLNLSDLANSKTHFEIAQPGADPKSFVGKVVGFLRKRGYKVIPAESPDGIGIAACRARFVRWCSPVFHVAILLVIIGGALTALTRFAGVIELVEGQSVVEEAEGYVKIVDQSPLFSQDEHRGFAIKLAKFEPSYLPDEEPKNFYSTLVIGDGWESQRMNTFISQPISYQNIVIYQQSTNGVAPRLTLSDEHGKPLDSSFVLFDKPHKIGNPLTGGYAFRNTSYSIEGRLYPNGAWKAGGKEPAWKIKNPILDLQVAEEKSVLKGVSGNKRIYDKKKEIVYNGKLALGQSVTLGGQSTIKFDDIKYWSSYLVIMDKGRPFIVTGFWLGLLSLGLLSLLNERRVSVIIRAGDGMVRVSGSGTASKYRASFAAELEDIVADLRIALGDERS